MAQAPAPTPARPPFTAWILGLALILGSLAFLAFQSGLVGYSGALAPVISAGVAVLALPFIGRWLARRDEWWALLSGWVFLALASLVMLLYLVPIPQIVLIVALLEVGAPFLAAYLLDPVERWWAVIPTYIMAALAALIGLSMAGLSLEMLGAFGLLAAALPLWALYMLDRSRTWAIVPAALISAIGIVLLILFAVAQVGTGSIAFYIILNVTLALTALALWLTVKSLDWAVWIAIGFIGAAIASIWLPGPGSWAIVALLGGCYILYRQIESGRQAQVVSSSGASVQPTPAAAPPAQPPAAAAPQPTPAPPPTPTVIVKPAPGTSPATATAAPERDTPAAAEKPPEGAPAPRSPAIEFRPIDPLRGRREDQDKP